MANGHDFGLPLGLAYQHNFQQDIQNRAMLHQMRRQKEIDQRAEAQLWAKELETASVQNPYDSTGLEKYLDGHFKKMGKWLQEHPNFRSDPEEYVYWTKQFVKPIKDNQFVKRDLSFQEQKKLYSAYVAQHGDEDEHAEEMTRQMQNYRNTGNTDGDPSAGVKEFMFTAPYDGFDPMEIISSSYKQLQPGNKNSSRDPLGNYWFNTTNEENVAWASQIVNDPTLKRHWTQYWNDLPDEEKLANNLPEHIAKIGAPFVVPKVKDLPRSYRTSKSTTDNRKTDERTYWDRDHGGPLEAMLNLGQSFPVTQANSQRINAVMQNPNGEIEVKDGSMMPLFSSSDGGQNVKRLGSPFAGFKTGQATGKVALLPMDGGYRQYYAEVDVLVGVDEMDEMEGAFASMWHGEGLTDEIVQPLDYKFWQTGVMNPDEANDVTIRKEYKDYISVARDPENQDDILGYNVKTWVPIDMQTEYNRRLYELDIVNKPKGSHPGGYNEEQPEYDAETGFWFIRRGDKIIRVQ